MKRQTVLIIFILVVQLADAQPSKRGSIWYFPNYAGIDFKTSPPTILNGSQIDNYFSRPGIMCDENGDLLLYSNGFKVWNKNHGIMVNGDILIDEFSNETMPTIIIPYPGNNNKYYIFSSNILGGLGQNGLFYSQVDIDANGGTGEVIEKKTNLYKPSLNLIAGTHHSNKNNFWVIGHQAGGKDFYAYHISESGVSSPVISSIGFVYDCCFTSGNQMVISPDGSKLAIAVNGITELYDFNSKTGKISNLRTIQISSGGVAFSPNSRFLYTTSGYRIFQFDVNLGDLISIENSKIEIGYDIQTELTDLQLAYNGRIYCSRGGGQGGHPLIEIKYPNRKGVNSLMQSAGYEIPDPASHGLPITISSYYADPTSIEVDPVCLGDTSLFFLNSIGYADSIVVNLGDGDSITQNSYPFVNSFNHSYSSSGSYAGTLKRYIDTSEQEYSFTAQVIAQPVLDLGMDTIICKGQSIILSSGSATDFKWSTGALSKNIEIEDSGTYWIKVETGPCLSIDSIDIEVIDYPQTELPELIITCEEEYLLSATKNTLFKYKWSTLQSTPAIMVNTSGQYFLEVANKHCISFDTTEVKFESIFGLVMERQHYLLDDTTNHDIRLSSYGGNIDTWQWIFGDRTEETTIEPEVTHTFPYSGNYNGQLRASNNWCSSETSFTVEVPSIILVPNIFTPNGDGFNDRFDILFNGDPSLYYVRIFNRHGKLIYTSSSTDLDWEANESPSGTYYVEAVLGEHKYKGWLMVLK